MCNMGIVRHIKTHRVDESNQSTKPYTNGYMYTAFVAFKRLARKYTYYDSEQH